MRKRIFLKIWTLAICFATLLFTSKTMAQSGQIQGSSSSSGDLYQEKYDIGVGSVDNPKARIHIFNGNTNLIHLEARNKRPFLITGSMKIFLSVTPTTDENIYF